MCQSYALRFILYESKIQSSAQTCSNTPNFSFQVILKTEISSGVFNYSRS